MFRLALGSAPALGLATCLLTGAPAQAVPVTLVDQNSQVSIDPATQAGVYEYRVRGRDNMYQQSFWYRLGGEQRETNISALPITFQNAVDADSHPGLDTLAVVYDNGTLQAEVRYNLQGSLANSSSLTEQVTLTNMTGSVMSLTFFAYQDWDLSDNIVDYDASFLGPNKLVQRDQNAHSEVTASHNPDRWEISYYPDLLISLNDAGITTLANATSPLLNGDLVSAFEWNVTILPNQSFDFVLVKQLDVPEPASLALLGLGLAGLGMLRRRVGR